MTFNQRNAHICACTNRLGKIEKEEGEKKKRIINGSDKYKYPGDGMDTMIIPFYDRREFI